MHDGFAEIDTTDAERVLERMLGPMVGGVVGVLRSDDPARAIDLSEAAISAGLACIEITWTTPGAAGVVRTLRERHPGLLIGAGSVFDDDDVASARGAGAEFVVSPHLSERVSAACAALALPYVPGVATASEVVRAMETGHQLVKLFPIAQLGGPAFVRALRGPVPTLRAMVTGGVAPEDLASYREAGAALVGLGSIFGRDASETYDRVATLMRGR